jgi:UDP-N-acetylglucosamine--N-acetylmuramyl-(pentapeptide) pyrophosphoryl-undecaprenol N-acetylglucosamine transferase
MPSPKIIISGGGTGGHIFPAIAIAEAIKKAEPEAEFLFVGAKGRMEMERVPAAGYDIEGLWISGIQRSLTLKNLSFPFKLISSLLNARKIVKKFKPDLAVGVGGYASGPLLKVATSMKIPSLIQEQNSYPGITNKLLAKSVDKICVAYEGLERWFPKEKIVMTGNPVREAVVDLEGKRKAAAEFFNLNPDIPTLVVVGGSLGARTINQSIEAGLNQLEDKGYQLIWQTGKLYAEQAKTALQNLNSKRVVTLPFIDRMDYAYAMADVLVSRAGAMSVSEICLVAKPSILVPSPNVAEDHQTKNAKALADKNAAILISDAEAAKDLVAEAVKLLGSEQKRSELSTNARKMAFADASEKIALEALKLIRKQ